MPTPNLFTRDDTIFGACEGIGEDFGFNAQYLRVALGLMMFWNPLAALGTYAVLGLAVLTSRKLFPVAARHDAAEATPAAPQPALAAPTNDTALPLAAAA